MSKKVKKGGNDLQVGNFLYHMEEDYIKVSDISGVCSHRVSTIIPKGQQLKIAIETAKKGDERSSVWLQHYAVVMFNALCCVFDYEYLNALNVDALAVIERHKSLYSSGELSKEEDDKILEGVKDTHKALEEIKKDMANE